MYICLTLITVELESKMSFKVDIDGCTGGGIMESSKAREGTETGDSRFLIGRDADSIVYKNGYDNMNAMEAGQIM